MLARPLSGVFGLPDSLRPAAVSALLLISASLAPAVVNNILVYYYMTVNKTGAANRLALGRGLLFSAGFAWLLARLLGTTGIWLSFAAGELCALAVWRLTARKGLSLPDTANTENEQVLSFAVANNREAVLESSVRIEDFCERCELTPKQSMMVSLSIEEILLIMIDHGFADTKERYIGVRIVCGETVILRFRCDGKPFNPLEHYKKELAERGPADAGESLGLKMISKAAKKIDYTTSLGFNNIIVTI
jgi:hypothetical protein